MFYIYIIIISIILVLYFVKQYIRGGKCTIKHSMRGKFIIITGASSGLGKYATLDLLSSGAKVILACRNEQKANDVIKTLSEEVKKQATFIKLDLCDFQSIISFTNEIKENYPKIDILMNNAGAQPCSFNITKDGFESFIQGNYIGMVLLSFLLIEHFNHEEGRIINVSSIGHFWSDLELNNFEVFKNNSLIEKKFFASEFGKFNLYFTSKLMIIYFTQYLSSFFEKTKKNIKVAAVHPGIVNTNFVRFLENYKIINFIFNLLQPLWIFFSKTTEEGAQTQLYLSYLPYNEILSGSYYADCKVSPVSQKAKDESLKKEVMKWTFETIKKGNLPEKELINLPKTI